MNHDNSNETGQQFLQFFSGKKPLALFSSCLVLLAFIAFVAVEHWLISHAIEGHWGEFAGSLVCWLLAVAIAASIAGFLVKEYIKFHEKQKWGHALAELKTAHETSLLEIRKLQAERSAFEAERDRVRGSLADQERQFHVLVKNTHDWLYNDEQILQLEAATDSGISVLAPDFFYEQQPQYEAVIIQNLFKSTGPVYDYFVLETSPNEGALANLRARLELGLSKLSCSDPKGRVQSQFKVHFIPDREFPHSVGYGLAIYRFADPNRTRCLAYWPREIGSWNLDILAAGKQDGKKIVDAINSQLQALGKKYPPR